MSENGFSNEDIKKLGTLARMNITDEESSQLAEELSSILNYVDKLNEFDVSDIEPLSHVHGSTNILRTDEEKTYPNRDEIISQAPDRSGTFIRVPLIVSQNDDEPSA